MRDHSQMEGDLQLVTADSQPWLVIGQWGNAACEN